MRLIFFGTAGAIQQAGNGNSSFLVETNSMNLLIDTSGSPVQSLLQAGVDPKQLDAVVMTHSHTDHIYAFPSLIHNLWLMGRAKPLVIFSNPAVLTKIGELCRPLGVLEKKNLFSIEWVSLDDASRNVVGKSLIVTLFPVEHSVATSGVKIEEEARTLVYSSDTSPCDRVVRESGGAAALIHEASGCNARESELNKKGHSSGRQAGEQAEKARVETLFLVHLDPQAPETPGAIRDEAAASFSGQTILPVNYRVYDV